MDALTGLGMGLGCLGLAALIVFSTIGPALDDRSRLAAARPHSEAAFWLLAALSTLLAPTLVGTLTGSPIGAALTGLTIVISTMPLLISAERAQRRIDREVDLEVGASGLRTDAPLYVPDAWR